MFEVSHSCENHRNIVLVRRVNRILIMDRPTRLNDRGDTGLVGGFNTIGEREEGIRSRYRQYARRLDESRSPKPRSD